MILLGVTGVAVRRPDRPLFEGLSFSVARGDRLGVVGINGTGKTTLLRVLSGGLEPEEGSVQRAREIRVGFLDQSPVLPPGTVREVTGGGWEIEAVLDRVGMSTMLDARTDALSGGQAKRVALAQVLVADTDVLILDEPTNHLDIDAIAWLEEHLSGYRGALVLVTHDRHVLDRVCTRVLELDRGGGYMHDGGYGAYLEGRAEREAQAESAESTRKILARQELAWLRRGAPARTRKSKARIESATQIIEGGPEAAARSASFDLSGAAGGGAAGAKGGVGWGSFGVIKRHPATPRLGDKVVELHGVGHHWPGGPWLFRGVDLLLDNRERLGVVGPNGGGKSTLLDVLGGRREPAEGRVVHGPTVQLAVYDQLGAALDLDQRVRDAVAGPHRQADWYDAALLEQFWFDADTQRSPIGLLSGGERRRLQLLMALAGRPNVLLLDEPTNDLDLDTLRILEEFLDDWPGALVVVSHDRAFLERTVTDVVVLDPESGVGGGDRFPGGYARWEEGRRATRTRGKASGSSRNRPRGSVGAPPKPGGARRTERPEPSAGGSPRSPGTVRHLLKEADKDMGRRSKVRDAAAGALDTAVTAGADHTELARLGTELAAAEAALAEVEERWLALSEELEGGGG